MRSLALVLFLAVSCGAVSQTLAQTLSEDPSALGIWEGQLVFGRTDMTVEFTLGMQNGAYTAIITSTAMGIYGMPADSVTIDNAKIEMRFPAIDLVFNGDFRADESGSAYVRLDGDWFQEAEMVPISLTPAE
ncbi:MAG: hypothetical protein WDZ76_09310 [Pseudohongiellaceae bacterium]